jgi:uncharacterized membrane protein YfcA
VAGAGVQTFLIIGGVVLLGALVQSFVGFGLGTLAAPVIAMVDVSLMPGMIILLATVLPAMMIAREWEHAEFDLIGWAVAGRVVGTPLGVLLVVRLPDRGLGIATGVAVLLAVALSLVRLTLPVNRTNLIATGAVSGVMATSAGIGGPSIALLFQHSPGRTVRASLGGFFTIGSLLSLVGLAIAGELGTRDFLYAAGTCPFLFAGFALAQPLRGKLDAGLLRPCVLALAAIAAVGVLVSSFA